MKKGLNKKAISNVVVAVLLIFIAVLSVLFLSTFIKDYLRNEQFEETQLSLNCVQDVEIEILGACYDEDLFKITIKNKRDIILGDFFLIVFYYADGESETIPTPYLTYIMPYETNTLIVPYKKSTDKIIVVPKIEEQSFLCFNSAPEFSNIKECENES